MKKVKEYRSLQINIAPGSYTGFLIVGSSIYFMPGTHWTYTIISGLVILGFAFCYDRPFRYILFQNKAKVFLFLCLTCASLVVPPVVVFFGNAFADFIGMMLIPIFGLLSGVFVFFTYTEEVLKKDGWINIDRS